SGKWSYTIFTLVIDPIVDCTTFGLYTSTVSRLQSKCSIPNQSHKRIIVPRFPGSRTSSNATISPLSGIGDVFFCSKMAKQVLGVVSELIFFNSCAEMSVILSLEVVNCNALVVYK